jgi:hypothetical protein
MKYYCSKIPRTSALTVLVPKITLQCTFSTLTFIPVKQPLSVFSQFFDLGEEVSVSIITDAFLLCLFIFIYFVISKGTNYNILAQLSRFYLKMETESSARNVIFDL